MHESYYYSNLNTTVGKTLIHYKNHNVVCNATIE